MKIKDFRDLGIWIKGMEITREVYAATSSFPKDELYGLSNQMRRAATSIPSNIAEGFNRRHNKEYRQFLYVALGSCGELETQCEIVSSLNYLSKDRKETLLGLVQHTSRMITKLISCLT